MSEKRLQEAIEYNDKKTDEMIDEIVFTRWIDPTIEEQGKEIERLGNEIQVQIEDNVRLNEYIEEKEKEIERLKEEKESWKRVATKNFNEAEDYKTIIKEVREHAQLHLKTAKEVIVESEKWLEVEEQTEFAKKDIHTAKVVKRNMEDILEILDKENI